MTWVTDCWGVPARSGRIALDFAMPSHARRDFSHGASDRSRLFFKLQATLGYFRVSPYVDTCPPLWTEV